MTCAFAIDIIIITREMQGIVVGRAWAHDVIRMHLSAGDMEWHAYFWAVISMSDGMEQ